MQLQPQISPATTSDIPFIKGIIDENAMFPSEYIDEMIAPFLAQDSQEMWFVVHTDEPIGVAYCAPERMTEGTWNLLLIAMAKKHQGQSKGASLMAHVENELTKSQARVLLVETSGLPDYALTRKFYPKCGYSQIARIPEYYDKGDDKIIFLKKLTDE